MGLAVFAAYVLSDTRHVLDSTKAFVAMSVFNILKNSITLLPPTIGIVVQAMVCEGRLSHALKTTEPDAYLEKEQPSRNLAARRSMTKPIIEVEMGNFSWAKKGMLCLRDVNFTAQRGQLIGIIGQAGSGKKIFLINYGNRVDLSVRLYCTL